MLLLSTHWVDNFCVISAHQDSAELRILAENLRKSAINIFSALSAIQSKKGKQAPRWSKDISILVLFSNALLFTRDKYWQ